MITFIKYRNRMGRYVAAAVVGAVIVGGPFGIGGPGFECAIYGSCRPGHTAHTFLIALAVGAIIGVVAMAIINVAVKVRYALINRDLAKQRLPKPPRAAN